MIPALTLLIEAAGGLVIAGHAAAAAWALLRGQGPDAARHILAEGAILALSVGTGAALLRTVGQPDWEQILMFTALLALRTILRRAFQAELSGPGGIRRGQVTSGEPAPAPP